MKLPADLAALLDELALCPVEVTDLTSIAHPQSTHTALRVETADGRRLKATIAWSEQRALTISRAGRTLAPDLMPRCLGRRGRALLFEWVEGQPVSASSFPAAARLLAEAHARSPRGLRCEPRLAPETAAGRLAMQGRALAVAGRISPSVARWLDELAEDAPPPVSTVGLLHTDLHPANLVEVHPRLVFVDNGSWSIGPIAYDLARAWWRWPIDEEAREDWYQSYRASASWPLPAPEELHFWRVVAAVGSLHYRHEARVAAPPRGRERLEELMDG